MEERTLEIIYRNQNKLPLNFVMENLGLLKKYLKKSEIYLQPIISSSADFSQSIIYTIT